MNSELVVIATTNDIIEAEFLRTHLEAEGFEVYMADNNIVGTHFFLANAVGGIKLKVPAEDAEEAAAFVEELRNAEIIEDENFSFEAAWGECPMCESRRVELEKEIVDTSILMILVAGVPTPKTLRKLKCNNCGNIWTEN